MVCAGRVLIVNSMYFLFLFFSGYDTSKTASCESFLYIVRLFTRSMLIETFFSVLLEIPQPYAMGVNILRNG